jgi:hypothetical protein
MAAPTLLLALLLPQSPATAGEGPPDFLLVPAAAATSVQALGPGSGGVTAPPYANSLQVREGSCTTPGGVRVRVQAQGVLLEFPNHRDLLFAPDGNLHLRSGEHAGPFPAGAELWLADGARVRIDRSGSRRNELQDVVVSAGGAEWRIWLRSRAVLEEARERFWGGPRLLCCGDGDAVYRAVGLGPLLTLERELCPRAAERDLPAGRLVLLVEPLLQSLQKLPGQVGKVDPMVAAAVDAVVELNRTATVVFAVTGPPPRRVEHKEVRYALADGYEVTFSTKGSGLRMDLRHGEDQPIVEWTLGYISELHLLHPEHLGGKTSRYWGRAIPMAQADPGLCARQQLYELSCAENVVQALSH